jgi:hypothetical protein
MISTSTFASRGNLPFRRPRGLRWLFIITITKDSICLELIFY